VPKTRYLPRNFKTRRQHLDGVVEEGLAAQDQEHDKTR
jgi:hypothetical protein